MTFLWSDRILDFDLNLSLKRSDRHIFHLNNNLLSLIMYQSLLPYVIVLNEKGAKHDFTFS